MESSVPNDVLVTELTLLDAMPFRGSVPAIQNGRGRTAPLILMSVKEGLRYVVQIYTFV